MECGYQSPHLHTVTMHSDRLTLSSASCMVTAQTAHGRQDLHTHDDGSSLSKLQINNQELRAGTDIKSTGQGKGAAGGLTIATRRAFLPLFQTTLLSAVLTGIDSMHANQTTPTPNHDLGEDAAKGRVTPCSALMPLGKIRFLSVNLTARSEALTQAEEVSPDIVRPTQASRGGEPCQSLSEGIKEQADLLPALHAKTCNCLNCKLDPSCCIQPASALLVLQHVRRVHDSGTHAVHGPATSRTLTVRHFSRHKLLDLQDDCLSACVHSTRTLCLDEMGMLAFTAAELKIVQTLEHWGFNDHWDHYSQHGPILNVASLLYFLLLLPFDALSNVDRARLVWFVDMVLYYRDWYSVPTGTVCPREKLLSNGHAFFPFKVNRGF